MRFVKVHGHYSYQHKGNRLEVVEPGSVVSMADELAEAFVLREMGEFSEGPEHLIRPAADGPPEVERPAADPPEVERPGLDPRPARAERAVAPAQKT